MFIADGLGRKRTLDEIKDTFYYWCSNQQASRVWERRVGYDVQNIHSVPEMKINGYGRIEFFLEKLRNLSKKNYSISGRVAPLIAIRSKRKIVAYRARAGVENRYAKNKEDLERIRKSYEGLSLSQKIQEVISGPDIMEDEGAFDEQMPHVQQEEGRQRDAAVGGRG